MLRPSWQLLRHALFALVCANAALLMNSRAACAQTLNRGTNVSLSDHRQTHVDETGSISGVAFDSLLMKPIVGATIQLVGANRTATSDVRGKFHFDRVTAGKYQVAMSTTSLDTLGFGTLGMDVDVTPRRSSLVAIAPPSLRTLWTRNCMPSNTIGIDSGIVWGTIRDARSRAALPDAAATFNWYDLNPGKSTKLLIREVQEQTGTNSNGVYFACGLPSDVAIGSEAITSTSASGHVEYALNARRVHRLDLVVSDEMVAPARTDSSADSSAQAPMRGSSTLRGVVLNDREKPLANALVGIANVDTIVRTDDNGRFQFTSLPAGTHALTVRRVGQPPSQQTVDLHPEQVTTTTVHMSSATTLTTVNVRAEKVMSPLRQEFEYRKKSALVRVREGEIFQQRSDLFSALSDVPEIVMQRSGFGVDILVKGFYGKPCEPAGYLDGFEVGVKMAASMPVEMYNAVEIYRLPIMVPPEYFNEQARKCGAILFWTKRIKW